MSTSVRDRYALTPQNYDVATSAGLVDQTWRVSPIDPRELERLARRSNQRATLDTALWLCLIIASGAIVAITWWSTTTIFALVFFSAIAGGASDARWHESVHGTAFRSSPANHTVLYVASFFLMRPATLSQWTHARHHSDTLVVGRDPEILFTRPPALGRLFLDLFNLPTFVDTVRLAFRHLAGRYTFEEHDLVPAGDLPRLAREARTYAAIIGTTAVVSIALGSPVPIVLLLLPSFGGAWLKVLFNTTQHGGLPENDLDFRRNTRTMRLNPVGRFLYLNMNYHIEHHMFPVVPYHALPALHAAIQDDLPPAKGLLATYREVLPTLWRQRNDPSFSIMQDVPVSAADETDTEPSHEALETRNEVDGTWLSVCASNDLEPLRVTRVDGDDKTFVLFRTESGELAALDGICSHSRTVHLAGGVVVGCEIECPKHNGRFDPTGNVTKAPPTKPLQKYPVRTTDGQIWIRSSGAENKA